MVDMLSEEAWHQYYEETGSEHSANAQTQTYLYRLQVSTLKAIKQEFDAVFNFKLPVEPLRPAHMDLRG